VQGKLLCALCVWLLEAESDPLDSLRFIEDKPDGLLADLDGSPTLPMFFKCGFDWISRIFRSRFYPREGFDIEPGCPFFWQLPVGECSTFA
jgi:hypothetical protein